MPRLSALGLGILLLLTLARPGFAQLSPSATWAAQAANNDQVTANLTFLTASNYESQLDIYARRGVTTPQPTVVYFHGGFWAAGSKDQLLTVPGGKHGNFTPEERTKIFATIREFLAKHGLG